ncbi:MAG TPA: glycosyltransferase family 4 protein [Anaerolineae bacterium]|nr:glycosyltransferase family 4 protein [Anaerolineae bacterium]
MRIALIGPFGLQPKMTMARRALPLAAGLVGRGHAATIVVPPWDCPEQSGLRGQVDGVSVINIRLPARLPIVGHLLLTARLLRAALASDPEIIHCFKPKAYSGLVAVLVRVLQVLHLWQGRLIVDADDWEGKGGWNEEAGYSWPYRCFFSWQEQWGLRHCEAVTAASRWLCRRVGEMRADRRSVWYVPNGAAQGESDFGQPSEGDSPSVLLYTRFVEHSPADVCEVWRVVHEAMPSARLVVVGQGIRGEEQVLARMLAQHGLDSTTKMVHWVPMDQLKWYFHAADVAMMPVNDTILARAKSPARLLDLMAAGVPIACHAVGEYKELLHEGPSGLLVPPGDHRALGLAVVRLLSDEALRRRIGQAAKQRVESAFSWRELSGVVEQVYMNLGPRSGQ